MSSANPLSRSGDGARLHGLWQVVLHNRWLAIGVFAATLAAGALLTLFAEPVYQSSTTIRIDESEAASKLMLSTLSPLGGGGQGKIPTEMAVLRSRNIAEAVVDSLHLTVQLVKPNVARSTLLQDLQASRTAVPGLYVMTRQADTSYTVRWEGTGPTPPLPERLDPTAPISLGDVSFSLVPLADGSLPEEIQLQVVPFFAAVGAVRNDLDVARVDPLADIVSVAFETNDPVLAAAVPNVAARSFILYKTRTLKSESRSSVDFLEQQVAAYERDLAAAEVRLREFREQAQVVSLVDEATEQVRRLAELQARRDEVQAERNSLASLLAQVGTSGESASYRQLASFPVFLANLAIQNILQSLTALENQRAELLVGRTSENRDVQGVERRISELETQLYRTARGYLESLDNQLVSLNANLARFGSQLATIPAREIEYARLLRQQKLLEETYTLLQTRLKEAEIQEAIEPGDVRVLDSALVPQRPVSPRPARNFALTLLLAGMLSLGAAFGREALDTKVRSKADVEEATGGAAVLGVIPRIKLTAAAVNGNGNGNGNGKHRHGKVRTLSPQEMVEERLITHLAPRDPASEAYRALRTSINFAGVDGAPQVLVMTSAMPGDGKSTSSANLAITLAQQGTRTLLVDCDLRMGLLHRVFNVAQEPGLTHLLMRRASLDDAVRTVSLGDGETPLHFLPTGIFPPNPAELLGSPQMREILSELRERYETIVLDAPPVNLVTDAAVLAKAADSTVVVVRSGTTDRRAVEHAVSQLRDLNVSVAGVILNDVKLVGENRYYGTYGYGV